MATDKRALFTEMERLRNELQVAGILGLAENNPERYKIYIAAYRRHNCGSGWRAPTWKDYHVAELKMIIKIYNHYTKNKDVIRANYNESTRRHRSNPNTRGNRYWRR